MSTDKKESISKGRKFRLAIRDILIFICCALISGVVASSVGLHFWFSSGQNPDNSGGTLIFFYGGIASGLLGLAARFFTRRRAVLYGLTFFMWNTAFMAVFFAFP
jgi:hypothetical protein